jgi:hypothetical protein
MTSKASIYGFVLVCILHMGAVPAPAEVDPALQARAEALLRPSAERNLARKIERQRDSFIAAYAKANKGERQRVAAFFDAEVEPRLRQRWEIWLSTAAGHFVERVGPSGIASYEQFIATPAGQRYREWGRELASDDTVKLGILSELGLNGAFDVISARKEMLAAMHQAGLMEEGE